MYGRLWRKHVISIHAPPRGATRRTRFWQLARYFNSRPSARGDQAIQRVQRSRWHFNSRPSARGDVTMTTKQRNRVLFQFTPLREGRPFTARRSSPRRRFQFTPLREGRHVLRAVLVQHRDISIHAPPRGATNARREGEGTAGYFNSRPSARGDELQIFKGACPKFQFTPLREGRRGGLFPGVS